MADLRIQQVINRQPAPINPDAGSAGSHREREEPRREATHPGAEELALALARDGRAAIEAHYEEDEAGNPHIRIVDAQSGETVAMMSPAELRALAEQTGLPPGLLLRTAR